MGKTRLTPNDKWRIISTFRKGYKPSTIYKLLKASGSFANIHSVKYFIRQYQTGEVDMDKLHSTCSKSKGRTATFTDTDCDIIRLLLEQEPHQSNRNLRTKLTEYGLDIRRGGARNAIATAGFTSAKPRYCQHLRPANRQKRLEFCRNLLSANENFNDVIFSDECSVQLHQNKIVTYRAKDAASKLLPKHKHPYKIHIWGGISRRGPTKLLCFDGIMKSEFYTSEILGNTLLPFLRATYPDGHRFQQDNDPKHKSRLSQAFMADNGINWWQWPSESCDLNPIEMVWNQLKRYIAKMQPQNKEELLDKIERFWLETVTPELCNRYIDHLFKVIPICEAVGGKATGDLPNRTFLERSEGKNLQYFARKLQEETTLLRLKRLVPDLQAGLNH